MAFQPGLPGSQFPSEDALIRRIQEIEKAIQQLAAANPFAPMGITPVQNGINLTGAFKGLRANGSTGAQLDAAGFHAYDSGGAEVTTIQSADGTLKVSYPTGDITIGNSVGVPCIFLHSSGGTQTVPGEIQSTNNALSVTGPSTSDNGSSFSYLNLLDTAAEVWVGPNAGRRMLNLLSTWAWQVGDTGTGHPSVYGLADGSWVLGRGGGNQIFANATGATQITGGLTVTGTKNFSMPHPVNPETKSLVHASTESPVNGVEYWGTVTLDATGEATAALPSYFEALTKATGRNIQLTPIGRATAQVSADRIVDGAFTIYGAPGQGVDWLVKAERHQFENGVDLLAFDSEPPSGSESPAPPPI